jgi:hypothetical protein
MAKPGKSDRNRTSDSKSASAPKRLQTDKSHPHGRKGSASFAEAVQRVMESKVAIAVDGQRVVLTGRDAIAWTLISGAEAGDLSLIKALVTGNYVRQVDRPFVIEFEYGDQFL